MKKENENMWTQQRKKLKTDWLQLDWNLCHLSGTVLAVVLCRTLSNRLKQCAELPRIQIGKVLSICVLVSPTLVKQKNPVFRFPGEWDLFGKNSCKTCCLMWSDMLMQNSLPWTSSGGGGALECNLTGRWPFLKEPQNPFRKKICISIPCFGIIRLQNSKNNRENNSLLFLKTIAYCSWTNSHNLFRNFWLIFISRSGIYAEKWYPEKRHVRCRFIWKFPPPRGLHKQTNERETPQTEHPLSKNDPTMAFWVKT